VGPKKLKPMFKCKTSIHLSSYLIHAKLALLDNISPSLKVNLGVEVELSIKKIQFYQLIASLSEFLPNLI